MVSVTSLPATDLGQVRRLHNRFTASSVSRESVEGWYDDAPALFVGAYDADDELVGYCLGRRGADDTVELEGIGVQPAFRRQGIGSQLVQQFESTVAEMDVERIEVDSAGGYVDRFYVENGFTAQSILVRLEPGGVPNDYDRFDVDVVEGRREDGVQKLYVEVDDVDANVISEVRGQFGDPSAVYLMEKRLD
jgi:ribosomal protein S18 acetylase RimI-like enzyme